MPQQPVCNATLLNALKLNLLAQMPTKPQHFYRSCGALSVAYSMTPETHKHLHWQFETFLCSDHPQ